MGINRYSRAASYLSSIAILTSLVLAGSVLPAGAAAPPSWSSAGTLALARLGHRATLLTDGKVLVTGGNTAVGNTYDTHLAELYDPVTNSWSSTGSTANGRDQGHTATRLPDGKVLVAGGVSANICASDASAEVYDPSTGTWSFTGSLSVARYFATATALPDGKVLVAGGGDRCGTVFSSAEIYDPADGTWSPTGGMTTAREFHSAVALADGRVLVVGGFGCCFPALASAEIFDPDTGTWTATGSMTTTRSSPNVTRLADGRVMAAGGYSGTGFNSFPNGNDVELYDPALGTWSSTGSMVKGHTSGSFTLLSNGKVLAAGGIDAGAPHSGAELWNPATGSWSLTASMSGPRLSPSATLLTNGKVLVAAGYDGVSCCLTSAELYCSPGRPIPRCTRSR